MLSRCSIFVALAVCGCFYEPASGSDTDNGNGSDTGVDTDSGAWCFEGVLVSEFPFVWTGSFDDFSGSYTPGPGCGNGDGEKDVWFEVLVPTQSTLEISEVTSANVTIRRVSNCQTMTCLEYDEDPELMTIFTYTTPKTFNIVVSEAGGNPIDDLEVHFDVTD